MSNWRVVKKPLPEGGFSFQLEDVLEEAEIEKVHWVFKAMAPFKKYERPLVTSTLEDLKDLVGKFVAAMDKPVLSYREIPTSYELKEVTEERTLKVRGVDLLERQRNYDELVQIFSGEAPAYETEMDLHARVMAVLNGEAPDPRKKP